MDWVKVFVVLIGFIVYENAAVERIKPNQEWVSDIIGENINRQDDNCSNCTCGQSLNTKNINRIIGGQPAVDLKYPWMVLVNSNGFMCGGSLINDRYVLLAAHCITTTKENIKLTFGTVNMFDSTNGIEHKVDSFILHPNYDAVNIKNDVALIKLEEPINLSTAERIGTICLPPEGPTYLGVEATAIGWGLTQGHGITSRVLREVTMPVPDDDKCKKIFRTQFDENQMCYGNRSGTQGACEGDSGGPLMIQNATLGAMQQIGVVSYGVKSCNTYSVFSRLNKFLNFIETNTADACKCPEPVGEETRKYTRL